MNHVELTSKKLSIDDIGNLVAHSTCGAVSFFTGFTRDNFAGKKVLALEYEAYEPMAIKQMKVICDSIRDKWSDVLHIAIYHRLGLVPVCEASVVIAISSPHRKSALEAVTFAIESLKKTVPIWKKEIYEADDYCWKENKELARIEQYRHIKIDCSQSTFVEEPNIPHNLVQISANENEIKRRIQCFVQKKREEIDFNNIMDFTAVKIMPESRDQNYSVCARTNTVVIKQEDSSGHLRVRRVSNRIGPQIRPDYLQTLDKLMSTNSPAINSDFIKQEPIEEKKDITTDNTKPSVGLCTRLSDIENHLNIKVINSKHIHERLKAVEDRLLHLESLSPEYKHFWKEKCHSPNQSPCFVMNKNEACSLHHRKTYSANEMEAILKQMIQYENITPNSNQYIIHEYENN